MYSFLSVSFGPHVPDLFFSYGGYWWRGFLLCQIQLAGAHSSARCLMLGTCGAVMEPGTGLPVLAV